jgi:hypothetical protein
VHHAQESAQKVDHHQEQLMQGFDRKVVLCMCFHPVDLILNVRLDRKSRKNTKKNGFRLLPAANDVNKAVHECVQDDKSESQVQNPAIILFIVSFAIYFNANPRVGNCIESFGFLPEPKGNSIPDNSISSKQD